jgi:hypothetical protein
MQFFSSFLKQGYRIYFLAPGEQAIPSVFKNVLIDPKKKQISLKKVQRLRAESYLHRGIIQSNQLIDDAYFPTDRDHLSWHLIVEKSEELIGCIKYRVIYDNSDILTKTLESILRLPREVQEPYLGAYDEFSNSAKGMIFGEVTNWLISPHRATSRVAIFLALSGFAFFRLQGEAKVVSLVREGQMTVETLLRIGGKILGNGLCERGGHYDSYYKANQRIVTFYSEEISDSFKNEILAIQEYFSQAPVYIGVNVQGSMQPSNFKSEQQ